MNRTQGVLLFFFGIVIASFVGAGSRVFLNSTTLRAWLTDKVQDSQFPFEIQFKDFRFVLAEGMIPRLGFELSNAVVFSKDSCRDSTEWHADRVYFPLRLSSLVNKKIGFSDLQFGTLEVFPNAHPCERRKTATAESLEEPKSKAQPSSQPERWIPEDAVERARKFVQEVWPRAYKDVEPWISGLFLRRVLVFKGSIQSKEDIFEIENLKVELTSNQELKFRSTVQIPREFLSALQFKPVEISGMIHPDHAELEWSGKDWEGRLHGKFSWRPSDEVIYADLNLEHYPMRTLAEEFKKRKLFLELQSFASWLSCESKIEIPLHSRIKTRIAARSCEWSGDFGKIELVDGVFYPFGENQFEPFHIHLRDLKVKSIFESAGLRHFDGIMTNAGLLQASIHLKNLKSLEAEGELQGVQFYFANNGKRALQTMQKMKLKMDWDGTRWKGAIGGLELQGGEFAGEFTFNLDSKLQNGPFQVAIQKFKLSPEVNELFFKQPISLEIYGQGWVENGIIRKWQGVLGLDQIQLLASNKQQTEISASKVKIQNKLLDKSWQLNVTSEDFIYGGVKQAGGMKLQGSVRVADGQFHSGRFIVPGGQNGSNKKAAFATFSLTGNFKDWDLKPAPESNY